MEAIKKGETEKKNKMILTIEKEYPKIKLPSGKDLKLYFRAAGKGQQPWDLLKEGFVHRTGTRKPAKLKAILAEIYGEKHGGANTYMSLYRISGANNPANAPFISAGTKGNDAKGSANAYWDYYIDAGVGKLKEIKVTNGLLGLDEETVLLTTKAKIGDVKLLMDNVSIDSAKIILLLHGPLPECTWLTGIPKISIKAWIRLGGEKWQRKWRVFDDRTVKGIRELTLKNKIDIAQS
jgi:hypothetical protein